MKSVYKCSRCETIPSLDEEARYLFIAPAEAASGANIQKIASSLDLSCEPVGSNLLCIELPLERRAEFGEACTRELLQNELQDARAMLVRGQSKFDAQELLTARGLSEYAALLQNSFLLDILSENRLTTLFHPIVHCNDPSSVFANECLLRAINRDGVMLPPTRLFRIAKEAGLLFQLDRAARLTALAVAAEHQVNTSIFINFIPTAIYRPEFCLRTTFAAAQEHGLDPKRIVFEVVESEAVTDIEHLRRILNEYRAQGFRVALDDLGAGFSSLNMLHELRPDIVKLDMELVRGIDKDPYKASICRTLLQLANDLGIASVAEGVETVGEWEVLRDAGATYLQGFLFAKPSAPPATPVVPTRA